MQVREVARAHAVSVESRSGFLDSATKAAVERSARELNVRPAPVLTYIANTIRIADREIPYSVVTAMDLDEAGATLRAGDAGATDAPPGETPDAGAPIWLNEIPAVPELALAALRARAEGEHVADTGRQLRQLLAREGRNRSAALRQLAGVLLLVLGLAGLAWPAVPQTAALVVLIGGAYLGLTGSWLRRHGH